MPDEPQVTHVPERYIMAEPDASLDRALQQHLDRLLSSRAYPKTICPSEVARAVSLPELRGAGAQDWRDLMPRVRELAWQRKHDGNLEVLQKGEVLEGVGLEAIRGPIRLRLRRGDNPEQAP